MTIFPLSSEGFYNVICSKISGVDLYVGLTGRIRGMSTPLLQ